MTLLVTEIKFDYTANTNPFHAPITENGKQQIESEVKIYYGMLEAIQN